MTLKLPKRMPLVRVADAVRVLGLRLKSDLRGNLVAVPACGFRHDGTALDVDYDDARDLIRCASCQTILWPPCAFLTKQAD